jgi:hypothetical protein
MVEDTINAPLTNKILHQTSASFNTTTTTPMGIYSPQDENGAGEE